MILPFIVFLFILIMTIILVDFVSSSHIYLAIVFFIIILYFGHLECIVLFTFRDITYLLYLVLSFLILFSQFAIFLVLPITLFTAILNTAIIIAIIIAIVSLFANHFHVLYRLVLIIINRLDLI